jgi:hypothetical protein
VLSPPDVEELEPPDDCFDDEPPEPPEPAEAEEDELFADCCAVAAWDPPGRVTATPVAASTLAAPAAIVTDRNLEWCRSRAAIAACLLRRSSRPCWVIVDPLRLISLTSACPAIFCGPSDRAAR